MGTGFGDIACHGVLIDLDESTGGSGAASLPKVFQDGQRLVVWQAGLLKDRPFSFGEGSFAGSAVDQANPLALAAVTPKVEVFASSNACLRALGILAAEVLDGDHVNPPCSEEPSGPELGPVVPFRDE
jgi:hypothetical protein